MCLYVKFMFSWCIGIELYGKVIELFTLVCYYYLSITFHCRCHIFVQFSKSVNTFLHFHMFLPQILKALFLYHLHLTLNHVSAVKSSLLFISFIQSLPFLSFTFQPYIPFCSILFQPTKPSVC